jgi:hypothetical protein
MTAGFQVFAQDGSNVAQIDSVAGLGNIQLRQKITQTMSFSGFLVYTIAGGSTYSSQGNQTTFSFTAVNPLVVFECPTGYAAPMTWTPGSNNSWTLLVVGDSSVPVTIYVFDQVSAISAPSSFGLQVFDASGALMADVVKPFARVAGFAQGNPKYAYGSTGFTSDSGTWSEPQGSSAFAVSQRVGFACVQPAFGTGGTSGGASNAGVVFSLFNTSGGTITTHIHMFGDTSNFNNYVGYKEAVSWSYMAVDISFL